jgi:hypothetical protein
MLTARSGFRAFTWSVIMRTLNFLTCVALSAAVVYGQAFTDDKRTIKPSNRLQLIAEASSATVKLGQPVVLNLNLRNISAGTAILDKASPPFDYRLTVADASGKEPPLTDWGRKSVAREVFPISVDQIHLDAGEEIMVSVEIKGYQLSQPGTYFVRATRLGVWTEAKEDNQKFSEMVYSNPVQFTIVP